MMKKYFFAIVFVCAIFYAGSSFSQSINWSTPLSENKKFPFVRILGSTEEGYYILRSNITFGNDHNRWGFRTRKYLLQLMTDDLRLKLSRPLSIDCEDCRIADVGIIGENVAILYSTFDKRKRLLQLYIQKLGNDGNLSGNAVLLIETTTAKVDEDNQPDLIYSQDENLIACAIRSVSKDNEEQLYSTAIFDTGLAVIGKKEFRVPVKAKLFGPITSVLSDEGNFYLLGIEFRTEKRVKNPGESFYKLISYNLRKDIVTQNEIKLENRFLTDVAISVDNLNHKVVVSGFYSDKTAYTTSGVFYYSLSEDSLFQTPVVTSSFSPDFLRKLVKEGRSKDNELVNYSIGRSAIRKDGGAAIVAESFNITSRSYWDYYLQTWVYHYYYHYGNIIAFSINPDGTLLWSNAIQKDQNSTDDAGYYSSYFSAIVNGKILNIYNKYITEKSSVLVTTISGVGEQQTKTLFEESLNASVVPHSAKQVDEDTILMPVERDGDQFLVKIVF